MTTRADIVNLALQYIGTRTTVTTAELAAQTSNEAIQAELVMDKLRDQTLRMAPWNCALNTANLVWITSTPGTPENTSAMTTLWEKGQPPPPWAYEYQYPVDCLRPCWIIPATQTGFSGVPITTAVTGSAPNTWTPPVIYKVQVDQFYPVTAAVIAAGGTGHAVGDIITLEAGATDEAPIGAPAKLRVATVAGGVILTVTVVNQIAGSATPQGGSYFLQQTNPVAQGSSTGAGINATFTLTYGDQTDQRVILTNQEFAMLAYVKQVTNPNTMDDLFLDAWSAILGARLCLALTGDKALAKMLANLAVDAANSKINEARKADANEGLTINDVTPDWIRVRGILSPGQLGPFQSFDWGPLYSGF